MASYALLENVVSTSRKVSYGPLSREILVLTVYMYFGTGREYSGAGMEKGSIGARLSICDRPNISDFSPLIRFSHMPNVAVDLVRVVHMLSLRKVMREPDVVGPRGGEGVAGGIRLRGLDLDIGSICS